MKIFAFDQFAGRLRIPVVAGLAAAVVSAVPAAALELGDLEFRAAGWTQYSYIVNSSDKGDGQDYNGRSLIGNGAQVTFLRTFSDRLEGAVGLGVALGHTVNGSTSRYGGYAPATLNPYIAEANVTYHVTRNGDDGVFVRGGFFPYNYNPDVKNLGLYLLRGPVYPGVLMSGFETKHVLPVANMLGVQIGHRIGGFSQDLIVNSETELAPFYDLSPAYVASYTQGRLFRVGAGVNFYHLIPIDGKTTRGEAWAVPNSVLQSTDTIAFSGTKLMANAAFDPKALFGDGIFGREDLKVYAEIALIGLDNDSAHEALYGGLTERMPVMVGINLPVAYPAFRILDHLSLEVQWYGSRLRDDLTGYNHTSGVRPSPLPVLDPDSPGETPRVTRDDWKWSLHGARMFGDHVKWSIQAANDHFRPGIYAGDGDNNPPRRQGIMITPKDWYLSTKIAYFF